MGKRVSQRMRELAEQQAGEAIDDDQVEEDDQEQEQPQEDQHEVQQATLVVPLGPSPNGDYEGRLASTGRVSFESRGLHVNAQLDADNAITFLRIRNGLRQRNEKLENGRPVWTNVDALRWMMEQVGE